MTLSHEIDTEYYKLVSRSEELVAKVYLMRETEPVDWDEVHRLHKEINLLYQEMQVMRPTLSG